MSSIFSKYNLEEKPSPEIKEAVEIKVPVPEEAQKVKIKAKINDRRKEGIDKQGRKFDRSFIAQKLQGVKDSTYLVKPALSILTSDTSINPETAAVSSVMKTLGEEKEASPPQTDVTTKKGKRPPMKINILKDKAISSIPEESQISSSKKIGKLKL